MGITIGSSSTLSVETMRRIGLGCMEELNEHLSYASGTPNATLVDSALTLFDTLDGLIVRAENQEWHFEVFSIVREAGTTWLQVILRGEPCHTLMLKLSGSATLRDVTSTMTTWLMNGAESGHTINVA